MTWRPCVILEYPTVHPSDPSVRPIRPSVRSVRPVRPSDRPSDRPTVRPTVRPIRPSDPSVRSVLPIRPSDPSDPSDPSVRPSDPSIRPAGQPRPSDCPAVRLPDPALFGLFGPLGGRSGLIFLFFGVSHYPSYFSYYFPIPPVWLWPYYSYCFAAVFTSYEVVGTALSRFYQKVTGLPEFLVVSM